MRQLSYSPSYIPGLIEIDAPHIVLEMVRGKTLNFISRIQQTQNVQGISIHYLEEHYDAQSQSIQGPTAGLAALVSLGVGIATMGSGTALIPQLFAAGTLENAVISAGFSSLCSQAAVALLSNEGDPFKAIESLSKGPAVKSLAIAMVSAGAMHEISGALSLPKAFEQKNLLQHAQYNCARASVAAILNMSIQGQSFEEAISSGALDAVVGTVAGVAGNKIGALYSEAQIDGLTQKLLHGVVGGLSGLALEGPGGMVAGALGGVVAATVSDLSRSENLGATQEEQRAQLEQASNRARLSAGTFSLFTHQNVALSIRTATDMTENGLLLPEARPSPEAVQAPKPKGTKAAAIKDKPATKSKTPSKDSRKPQALSRQDREAAEKALLARSVEALRAQGKTVNEAALLQTIRDTLDTHSAASLVAMGEEAYATDLGFKLRVDDEWQQNQVGVQGSHQPVAATIPPLIFIAFVMAEAMVLQAIAKVAKVEPAKQKKSSELMSTLRVVSSDSPDAMLLQRPQDSAFIGSWVAGLGVEVARGIAELAASGGPGLEMETMMYGGGMQTHSVEREYGHLRAGAALGEGLERLGYGVQHPQVLGQAMVQHWSERLGQVERDYVGGRPWAAGFGSGRIMGEVVTLGAGAYGTSKGLYYLGTRSFQARSGLGTLSRSVANARPTPRVSGSSFPDIDFIGPSLARAEQRAQVLTLPGFEAHKAMHSQAGYLDIGGGKKPTQAPKTPGQPKSAVDSVGHSTSAVKRQAPVSEGTLVERAYANRVPAQPILTGYDNNITEKLYHKVRKENVRDFLITEELRMSKRTFRNFMEKIRENPLRQGSCRL